MGMQLMDLTLLLFLMAESRQSTTMLLMNTVAMLLMSSTVELLAMVLLILQFTHPSTAIMLELLLEHIYKLNYFFNKQSN